jgi:hypothetical protein
MLDELVYNTDISSRQNIDFDFPFYGNTFSSLYVSRYGWISFTDRMGMAHEPVPLPNSSWTPVNLISPFWARLSFSGGTSYVSLYSDHDMAVISWVDGDVLSDISNRQSHVTFQVVLYKDGRIKFQYKEMSGDIYGATIGIQNGDATIASQMVAMVPYAHDELATLIEAPWLRVEPSVETVPAGGSVTLNVISNPTGLEPAAYSGNISIISGDINGSLEDINIPVTMVRTGIEDNGGNLPKEYALAQNYPNPFNASTSIEFALPEASDVELDVYNVLGQKIATLVSDRMEAGVHSVIWDASGVSSGIYFYKLKAGDYAEIEAMTLLK